MTVRTKYIAYMILLHLLLLGLSFMLLSVSTLYFFAAEIFIILSAALSVRLYSILLRPIDLMRSGAEMLIDRDFSSKLVLTGQKDIDNLIDVYNKMIDSLRDERIKQAEQNVFLEKLMEGSPAGIIVLDFNEKISLINRAALDIIGMSNSDMTGTSISNIGHPLFRALDMLTEGEAKTVNITGSLIYRCRKAHFMDRGFYRTFFMIEEMTHEIVKTERDAYERVIRMMAHEVNNSIGAINSFLNSFRIYIPQLKQEDQRLFEDSLSIAIERNERLNKFMGNFAEVVKLPQPRKELYSIRQLLENIMIIFGAECNNRNITINCVTLAPGLELLIDVQQMEQVLINVVKNSIEAIGENGNITITLDDSSITITDNGKGIPEAVKSRLFTPFFSTKPQGQGIGLTVIREILLNHNFPFSLDSQDGLTRFKINFNSFHPFLT